MRLIPLLNIPACRFSPHLQPLAACAAQSLAACAAQSPDALTNDPRPSPPDAGCRQELEA